MRPAVPSDSQDSLIAWLRSPSLSCCIIKNQESRTTKKERCVSSLQHLRGLVENIRVKKISQPNLSCRGLLNHVLRLNHEPLEGPQHDIPTATRTSPQLFVFDSKLSNWAHPRNPQVERGDHPFRICLVKSTTKINHQLTIHGNSKLPSSSKFTLFGPNGCITKISTSTPVTLLRSPCRSKVAADKMLAQCMDWLKSSLALFRGGFGSHDPWRKESRTKNRVGTSAVVSLREKKTLQLWAHCGVEEKLRNLTKIVSSWLDLQTEG